MVVETWWHCRSRCDHQAGQSQWRPPGVGGKPDRQDFGRIGRLTIGMYQTAGKLGLQSCQCVGQKHIGGGAVGDQASHDSPGWAISSRVTTQATSGCVRIASDSRARAITASVIWSWSAWQRLLGRHRQRLSKVVVADVLTAEIGYQPGETRRPMRGRGGLRLAGRAEIKMLQPVADVRWPGGMANVTA